MDAWEKKYSMSMSVLRFVMGRFSFVVAIFAIFFGGFEHDCLFSCFISFSLGFDDSFPMLDSRSLPIMVERESVFIVLVW